jgi:ATP-binding cassette, subfamily A (ABC1), member 3
MLAVGSSAQKRVNPLAVGRSEAYVRDHRSRNRRTYFDTMICGQFFRQLKVLAWKNALLKVRCWGSLLLEIIIPTIIILALGGVKFAIPTTTIAESFPSDFMESSSLEYLYKYNAPKCRDQNLVYSCLGEKGCISDPAGEFLKKCQQRKIAVAPKYQSNLDASTASTAAAEFMEFARSSSTEANKRSTFTYFKSESDFISHLTSSSYSVDPRVDIYSSAIIFTEGYPNWNYDIRLNRTYVENGRSLESPDTSLPVNDISVKSPKDSPYLEAYTQLGIYTLTDVVNSFIATRTVCKVTGNCLTSDKVRIRTIGTAPFPNVKTLSQGFWSTVGFVFALLIIISLLFPLSNVIKALVQEKESKLREGMMMMALRGDALWFSWIVHFMLLFVPLSVILTLAGTGLFSYSAKQYIFIYFLTFFIAATSYAVLISNFFSNSRTAAIIGCLVFFMGFFIYVGLINSKPTRSTILAACLHPAAAFTFGTDAFIE